MEAIYVLISIWTFFVATVMIAFMQEIFRLKNELYKKVNKIKMLEAEIKKLKK